MSGFLGNGFDGFATRVSSCGAYIPSGVAAPVDFFAREWQVPGFKTLLVKPLHLAGTALKFFEQESNFPTLKKLAADAGVVKAFISGTEIITKLPPMLKAISLELGENTDIFRKYAVIKAKGLKEKSKDVVHKFTKKDKKVKENTNDKK